MTEVEKELLAQQADRLRSPELARTVRAYLPTGRYSERDVVRVHVLASAFGWERLPGWRLLRPSWKGRLGS